MNDDSDLRALKEFRSVLDDPRDGGLAKGRVRLARVDTPQARPRRRQWLLASAGAAAAVAVVVGAAATLQSPPKETRQNKEKETAQQPANNPPATDIPVAQGTRAPVNPAVTGNGGATHAKAVAALDRLAAKNPAPMQLDAGNVLYVKTYNLRDDANRYIHEAWTDPATAVTLRIRRTDGAATNIDDAISQEEIDKAAAQPLDLYRPAPAYYNGLPTDPAALRTVWSQWASTTYPDRDADGALWKDLYELFHYSEPFWTPQTRSAIYKALGLMPAVKGTTATIDNKQYDVICMIRPGTGTSIGECLLFDSATGRYAGGANTGADYVVKADRFEFVDFGGQPRPAPGTRKAPETKGSQGPANK